MSSFSAPLKGIAAFVFGMNFIAIFMKVNGSAVSGNLAWDLVSAFVKLELWIAAIAVIIAVCIFVFRHRERKEQEERLEQEAALSTAADTAKRYQENIQAHISIAAVAKELNIEGSRIKHQQATAPPRPTRKDLSKDEIRKRVLQELTGRNDI